MSHPVLLTRRLPAPVLQRLRDSVDLELNPHDRPLHREELLAGIRGKKGLLCLLTDRIDAEVMDAAPELKVISNYAVGYNNIDLRAARERQIWVTNTPGVLTEATAELAMGLLLAVARRLGEGDQLVRSGQWRGWEPLQLLGKEIHGSTLGIVGMGRIGKALARRAAAFGMNIQYWNRTRLPGDIEVEKTWRYRSLPMLLASSDVLSLHLAYSAETHHLINAEALRIMPAGSILINTARGALIDEAALVEALQRGHLGGAGLDVYEDEPRVHPGLRDFPNVLLLPHLGSATQQTREAMGHLAVENLLAGINGVEPTHIV
ncbi:MAG: D-glycerate dehydrogenase [Bacteroidota bacterium]